MTSSQLTVPAESPPPSVVLTMPPGNNSDISSPESNLLMLATLNHHNQNQSQNISDRRNTNESLDRSPNHNNNSRRPSWFLPKGLSKRPSVMINKVPLLKYEWECGFRLMIIQSKNIISSYLHGNQSRYGSKFSINGVPVINPAAVDAKLKNRRLG